MRQFSELSQSSINSALERLRGKGHLQSLGNSCCIITKRKTPHYTLTKKAIDYLNGYKTESCGEFTLHTNARGYEHLTAEPIRSYIDEATGMEVNVYPHGYAFGYAPQRNCRA
jgi:hypothetical protein